MLNLSQLFLLIMALSQTTSVDPNNYIWFNFNSTTTVQPFSDSYREVVLPCQTRIGTCAYKFTLLPPLWVGLEDKLLIPTADANRFGNYAVQVTVTELTGESLDFSLILEMSNGKVITYDRGEFFGSNNYNTNPPDKPSTNNNGFTSNNSSFRSFPTLDSVAQTFSERDIYDMSALVSNIINKNESCPVHLSYLNNVAGIVQEEIYELEGQTKVMGTELDIRYRQAIIL